MMGKLDFDAYMRAAATRRWAWGDFDCFLFAAGAVEAMTGIDHMAELRGYRDETSAAILLQERFGTLSLAEAFHAVAERACAQPVGRDDVRDGDVAVIRWERGFTKATDIDQSVGLGVFHRSKVYALTPVGLATVPLGTRVIELWRF